MNITDIKNIVGEAKTGEVATIRFFGKITEESTIQFNNEFDYLENYVRPSLIRVLINSEGGSVLYGMSTYSTIQNSKIPTECIIEGMAASMASIIWAAGTKSLMRDYSILMIHNPFLPDKESEDVSDLVKAFINQVKTIYRKRFGMKTEQIESIMDGDAGKDGTFFDSKTAVKAGIIPSDHVLHTSKQLCDKVKNELGQITEISEIQNLMIQISMEAPSLETENKHFPATSPNLNQIQNNEYQMKEENKVSPEYAAVTASLGFKENCEVSDVMSRITELRNVEAKLAEKDKNLKDAQTVIAGKDATITNLKKDLQTVTASLDAYKNKEKEERAKQIDMLVEAAIGEGKIDKSTKDEWVKMAESNYPLADSILASIPKRDQISKEIAKDPENIQAAAAKPVDEAEKQLAEKVQSVIGKDFQFKSLG